MTSRRLPASCAAALLAAATAAGCASTQDVGDSLDSCGDMCALAVGVVVVLPFVVTGAVGCVVGACTRCSEGSPPDTVDSPPPAGAQTALPPRSVDDAMSF